MSEEIKKAIRNYGIDVEDELDVSPFEFGYSFKTREYLAQHQELLDSEDKKRIEYYDTILLRRAEEFYEYLKPIKAWGNTSIPVKYWWWHLDKIVSGELNVDIINNTASYQGEIIKLLD